MISSTANAQIKYLIRLQEKNAVRRKERVYICEGRKMFAEILQYARAQRYCKGIFFRKLLY